MTAFSYLLILTQLLVAPLSGACADLAPAACEGVHHEVRSIGNPISTSCATAEDASRGCEIRAAADDRLVTMPAKPTFDSDFLGLVRLDSTLLASVSGRSAGGSALLDALPAGLFSLQAQHVRLQV